VSIGTGLALESLFEPVEERYDPSRVIEEKVEASSFKSVYINIETLIRNIFSSIPKTLLITSSPTEIAGVVESEVDIIHTLFKDNNPDIKVFFYASNYDKLHRDFKAKKVTIRSPGGETALLHYSKTINTISVLEGRGVFNSVKDFVSEDYNPIDALIFTHLAYDVLAYTKFRTLSLLQSHTGKIIRRKDYCKLYYPMSGSKIDDMPFFREMLYIMGDRNQIHPHTPAVRRQLINVAAKRKWNSFTTKEKVQLDLGLELGKEFRAKLNL
jgi:hypothetical protein